jgi:hypothetical protein
MVLDDVKFYLANETCRNKKLLLSYSVEQWEVHFEVTVLTFRLLSQDCIFISSCWRLLPITNTFTSGPDSIYLLAKYVFHF